MSCPIQNQDTRKQRISRVAFKELSVYRKKDEEKQRLVKGRYRSGLPWRISLQYTSPNFEFLIMPYWEWFPKLRYYSQHQRKAKPPSFPTLYFTGFLPKVIPDLGSECPRFNLDLHKTLPSCQLSFSDPSLLMRFFFSTD